MNVESYAVMAKEAEYKCILRNSVVEIGSERDSDDVLRQLGYDNGEEVAIWDIKKDGSIIASIEIATYGEQRIRPFMKQDDDDEQIICSQEDGGEPGERLNHNPEQLIDLKKMQKEQGKSYIADDLNCWLEARYYGSSGNRLQSDELSCYEDIVFGSISEWTLSADELETILTCINERRAAIRTHHAEEALCGNL